MGRGMVALVALVAELQARWILQVSTFDSDFEGAGFRDEYLPIISTENDESKHEMMENEDVGAEVQLELRFF